MCLCSSNMLFTEEHSCLGWESSCRRLDSRRRVLQYSSTASCSRCFWIHLFGHQARSKRHVSQHFPGALSMPQGCPVRSVAPYICFICIMQDHVTITIVMCSIMALAATACTDPCPHTSACSHSVVTALSFCAQEMTSRAQQLVPEILAALDKHMQSSRMDIE